MTQTEQIDAARERVVRNLLRAIAWDATSCEKEIFDGIMHSDLIPPRSAVEAVREWTRVIRANCDKVQRAVRKYMPDHYNQEKR